MGSISELNARIDTSKSGLLSSITRINNDRWFIDSSIMAHYSSVYDNSEGLLCASGIATCIHQMDRHLEAAISKLQEASKALDRTKITGGGR